MKRGLGGWEMCIKERERDGGKIEIEYYSESDLNRIYDLIIDGK